ncbi:MAG: T9SS type A sorting domain-containing protein [Chitinophagales bacterium]|nr:T9SS type A sorting domain-containing protein [Bacteroidota bacterium]MBK7569417.1 T9SS type A sorting domain-containing protein [Bacteroidota bacterium]MBP8915955.1 T9SS type A sorting domain-containing protein [Chitinophagales bacterium]MBP9220440.1 T9SS type A sorting domain-containing protein [Chitinophagales bacterium]
MKNLIIIPFLLSNFLVYTQIDPDPEAMLLEFYIDGGDTVWLEYEDTTNIIEARMPGDELARKFIGISPTGFIEEVNPGLHGVHTAGMFKPQTMPYGDYGEDQWELLSELRPTVLRFPGGEDSKFMHLLHTIIPSDPPSTRSVGYGYDIDELIRYFDYTDHYGADIDVFGNPLTQGVADVTWIAADYRKNFITFRDDYLEQLSLGATDYYIDHFIRLVEYIEDQNEGLRVKVVVDLNIISESPAECKAIVNYLRDNAIYDLEVFGVEMGNECYANFYAHTMGFNAFSKYWEYLNGDAVTGWDIDDVLEGDIESDHDFFTAFKGDASFTVKVGLVAFNNPDPGGSTDYALAVTDIVDVMPLSSDWNSVLRTYYNALIPISGTAFSRRAFDAIVIHPYYETFNYKTELATFFDAAIFDCEDEDFGGNWEYDEYDERLDDAFDFMKVKFKDFVTTEFKESYLRWSEDLDFDLATGSGGKELWTTEWNYKDSDGDELYDDNLLRTYSNTFIQGIFDFEWYLKNIKMNFDTDYRPNFFTIAAMHNIGGGAWSAMLSPAHDRELIEYGMFESPWDDEERRYYLPRTNYYVFSLLQDISWQNLKYVKTNFTINILNPNVQPTVFIDQSGENLYIFYTNLKDESQSYVLKTTGLESYLDAEEINVLSSEVFSVTANQPYSSGGKMILFNMNTCYNEVDNLFPLEYLNFQNVTPPYTSYDGTSYDPECGEIPTGDCLTVPKYSFGYIKVALEIIPSEKLTQHQTVNPEVEGLLYPNPTNNELSIKLTEDFPEDCKIRIFSADGKLWIEEKIGEDMTINVSELPVGFYRVEVINDNFLKFVNSFVKI